MAEPDPLQRPRFPWLRLLLLLALVALYWRSYRRVDLVGVFLGGGRVQIVASNGGRMVFWFSNIELGRRRAWTWDHTAMTPDAALEARDLLYKTPPLPVERFGFGIGHSGADVFDVPGAKYHFAVVPDWVFVALAGVWMVAGLRRVMVYRGRRRRGLCVACGYDLRETPRRCPECGADAKAIQEEVLVPSPSVLRGIG